MTRRRLRVSRPSMFKRSLYDNFSRPRILLVKNLWTDSILYIVYCLLFVCFVCHLVTNRRIELQHHVHGRVINRRDCGQEARPPTSFVDR